MAKKTASHLGPRERLIVDTIGRRRVPVIDVAHERDQSVTELERAGFDRPSLQSALLRLEAKGHAHRLQRGRYLIAREPSNTPIFWSLEPVVEGVLRSMDLPYFVSWHSALWYHGLIDQQSDTVYAAVPRRKRDVTTISARVHFVLTPEERFFGFARVSDLDWPVTMATIPRAIIDAFALPQYVGPAPVVVHTLLRSWDRGKLDPSALVESVKQYGRPVVTRRIGYFMDAFGIPGSDELVPLIGRSTAEPLFRGRERYGAKRINHRWRVHEDLALLSAARELK